MEEKEHMTLVADRPVTDNTTAAPRRTYMGKKAAHGGWPGVVRCLEESATGSFSRVLRHRTGSNSHSPTGFSWGYGGSGPAELARAILADFLEVTPSNELYQKFKFEVVALWPETEGWTLPGHALQAWLDACEIPRDRWKGFEP
jgi:hypothetical protein